MAFKAYGKITAEKEQEWKQMFVSTFKNTTSSTSTSPSKNPNDDMAMEAVCSVDDATTLAKPLLTKIFTSLAHASNRQQKNSYIDPHLINLSRSKIRSSFQSNARPNQITNDILGEHEFVLGLKSFLADESKIKTFFRFQVDVDHALTKVFPDPDVEHFIDSINQTNLSVLYVLANFRPITTFWEIRPYVRMAMGRDANEGEDDEEDDDRSAYLDR